MTTVIGGVEVLGSDERRTFQTLRTEHEQVLFCVQNQNPRPDWQRMQTVELSLTEHGAFVALDTRLIVLHDFGTASCRYDAITHIDVYQHDQRPIPCLWINTEAYPQPFSATTLSFLFDQEAQRAHPLHFFVDQKSFMQVRPYIDQIKGLVRMAQTRAEHAAQDTEGALVAQLERLAALHAAGHLSDDEFEAAKRKLLAG